MGENGKDKLPCLEEIKGCHPFKLIKFTGPELTIGRGLQNSVVIPIVQLSRTHCKFSQDENGCWQVTDTSQFGTCVNDQKIERFHSQILKDGDKIQIGPLVDRLIYRFSLQESGDAALHTTNIPTKIPIRTPKPTQGGINENPCEINRGINEPEDPSEVSKMTVSAEKSFNEPTPKRGRFASKSPPGKNYDQKLKELQLKLAQTECVNKEILEKLKIKEDENKKELSPPKKRARRTKSKTPPAENFEEKIKELQLKLAQTETENKEILEKLKITEEENKKQIDELRRMQEIEKEELLAKLQEELQEKERHLREKLEKDIVDLHTEKAKIETNITSELQRQNDESEQLLEQFRAELNKVKSDLDVMNTKKQALEHQLQNAEVQDQIENKELFMKEKSEILNNFNSLLENELQCSICNELFVLATTLNCMHTFCSHCIDQWKKKKNECPVCRTKITASNRTLAVDNFIDKVVESLTDDLKEKRKELIDERKSSDNLLGQRTKNAKRATIRRRIRSRSSSSSASDQSDDSDQMDTDYETEYVNNPFNSDSDLDLTDGIDNDDFDIDDVDDDVDNDDDDIEDEDYDLDDVDLDEEDDEFYFDGYGHW